MEIFHPEGTVMAVVGVAHDDVLNLREGPSTDFPVLTTLEPTGGGAVVTGRGWLAQESPWIEVTIDGITGWANSRFLAPQADTDDLTSQVIARLGSRPSAADMTELGRIVVDAMASKDPPSSIVMSVAPTTGDLGEVSYDVVGLGDDSVWALRLHVFGAQNGSSEFSLKSVEATSFCARGDVTDEGLCL